MPSAARTYVSFANFSYIGESRLKIASRLDAAQVFVVTIGTNDVLAFAESLVRDHVDSDPYRTDRAAVRAEGLADLGVLRGPEVLSQHGEELHLVQAVVAADEREHDAAVGHDRHRLRSRTGVDAQEVRDSLDRALAGSLDLLRGAQLLGKVRRGRDTAGDLEIGRVIAVLAPHEGVLSRAGRREEIPAAATAHDPRLGRNLHRLEPAALEDSMVRLRMLAEALVESGLVAVERVAVLHDELADAEQGSARARLVAVLCLKVGPDLWQLLVRLQLARVERHRLLVRQREDEVAAGPILEAEELRDADPARRLPELGRREHRSEHLLRAEGIELLADDLLYLAVHAPAERHEGPEAGADLADESAADEELVRDGLGVGRIFAKRREGEL